jgi:hypothetical protein
MMVTILTSTKLYMIITENFSKEQELAIQYKSLALDLFKILLLPKEKRGLDVLSILLPLFIAFLLF